MKSAAGISRCIGGAWRAGRRNFAGPPRGLRGHLPIVMLNCALRLSRTGVPESVTVMVNFVVPGCCGLPLIAPVAGLRCRPRGRWPSLTDQVYGGAPPAADSVAE
jgi:hypothetical protein